MHLSGFLELLNFSQGELLFFSFLFFFFWSLFYFTSSNGSSNSISIVKYGNYTSSLGSDVPCSSFIGSERRDPGLSDDRIDAVTEG